MNYDILIRNDFSGLIAALEKKDNPLANRKVMIITDSHINDLYGKELISLLEANCREVFLSFFEAGEKSKHLDTVRDLLLALTEHHFDRKDLILAFGGGVVGDIGGFTASVYMRGIDFVQMPTSLLAQVDSSIGGKTGVDFYGYKNLVGSFYEPVLVYMNLALMKTLPDREFKCGLGEILKHSLIRSRSYYEWLVRYRKEILAKDPAVLADMIEQSCAIKKDVVKQDLKENGIRAYLNFGHTLGHAIERECAFSLSHGACVSIGMVGACYLSLIRGYLEKNVFDEICDFLSSFGLPLSAPGLSEDAVYAAACSDKKIQHGTFRFVLLKGIGECFIDSGESEEEIREAIRFITI